MRKKNYYLRIILMGVAGTLFLSLVSLFFFIKISDMVANDYRYGYLLYIARSIERTHEQVPIKDIMVTDFPAPDPPKDDSYPLIQATEQNRISLWLVHEDGRLISSNNAKDLPFKWSEIPRPSKIHGILSSESHLFSPKAFVVKLDTKPLTYLISYNKKSLIHGPFLWIQGLHTFTTAALAVVIALSLSFYYLRRKSKEARDVLTDLESGNLKARFEIKRFDQFGNLILDFNRMADQIERLVTKLSETESSRSNLLQDLGHDLRTPLTSLTTSLDTLRTHFDRISEEDRTELFEMISADIRYFKDLLEKLTIVATIENPHYKSSTEIVDLSELLEAEIKNRQNSSLNRLRWTLSQDSANHQILGDQHLITRLFRNAFDNASHYARDEVHVKISTKEGKLQISIQDDGPGLSEDALRSFGKRRERRHVKERNAHDFSLGLGSVIMKAITQAHDGVLKMSNTSKGACLQMTFNYLSMKI